ncbi:hypothetical protein CEXT_419311 [Caerostris extrusa]|uniref:Uncharacterized protein n=1 Tax=Caerostris extrusa TaxID=172846 RepID=A0AAV4NJV8_CAEEX|nr:hypothetical protein CEXT_419311 [Caerostris extrusa]
MVSIPIILPLFWWKNNASFSHNTFQDSVNLSNALGVLVNISRCRTRIIKDQQGVDKAELLERILDALFHGSPVCTDSTHGGPILIPWWSVFPM